MGDQGIYDCYLLNDDYHSANRYFEKPYNNSILLLAEFSTIFFQCLFYSWIIFLLFHTTACIIYIQLQIIYLLYLMPIVQLELCTRTFTETRDNRDAISFDFFFFYYFCSVVVQSLIGPDVRPHVKSRSTIALTFVRGNAQARCTIVIFRIKLGRRRPLILFKT